MNPNVKRYAPLALVLGAVVLGVYVVRPAGLTGEAGAIHDTELLGAADDEAFRQLDELAGLRSLPQVRPQAQTVDADRLRRALSERPEIFASSAAHFRDNGCAQPGSAQLAELLAEVALRPAIGVEQRQLAVDIFMDAAVHDVGRLPLLPTDGAPRYSANPQMAAMVDRLRGAEVADLPAVPVAEIEDAQVLQACVHTSLIAAARLVRIGVEAPDAVLETARSALAGLSAQSSAAEPLVEVATAAAEAARLVPPLSEIATNPNLDRISREKACHSAIRLGASATELRARAGATADALRGCLVVAGEPESVREALTGLDVSQRIRAAGHQDIEATVEGFRRALSEVYEGRTSERPLSVREQTARLRRLGQIVKKSENPEALLASLDTLHNAHPDREFVPRTLASVMRGGADLQFGEDVQPTGLASALASVARGDTGVRLPAILRPTARVAARDKLAGVQAKGAPTAPVAAAEQAGQAVQDLSELCDVTIQPGEAQGQVDEATRDLGHHIVVCFAPGEYTGTLEINEPGVQLRSFEPHRAILTGSVLVARPAVLVGLQVKGPVVVAETARGTVVSRNRLERGGVAFTDEIVLSLNELGPKPFQLPAGLSDGKAYLPTTLRHPPKLPLKKAGQAPTGIEREKANVRPTGP
jgi:hypothetical protein